MSTGILPPRLLPSQNASVSLQGPPNFHHVDLKSAFPLPPLRSTTKESRWHPRKPSGDERDRLEAQAKMLTLTTDFLPLPADLESIPQSAGKAATLPSAQSWLESVGNLGQKIYSMFPSGGLPIAAASPADLACTADGQCTSVSGSKEVEQSTEAMPAKPPLAPAIRNFVKDASGTFYVRTSPEFAQLKTLQSALVFLADTDHNDENVRAENRAFKKKYLEGKRHQNNILLAEGTPEQAAPGGELHHRLCGDLSIGDRCRGIDSAALREEGNIHLAKWRKAMDSLLKKVRPLIPSGNSFLKFLANTVADTRRPTHDRYNMFVQLLESLDFDNPDVAALAPEAKAMNQLGVDREASVIRNAPARNIHFAGEIRFAYSNQRMHVVELGWKHIWDVIDRLPPGLPWAVLSSKAKMDSHLSSPKEREYAGSLDKWRDPQD